jgi:hypothetical protein
LRRASAELHELQQRGAACPKLRISLYCVTEDTVSEMAWQREEEFRRLLDSNIKHLTKDGLDKMVAIAVKEMPQARDDRSTLCRHVLQCMSLVL